MSRGDIEKARGSMLCGPTGPEEMGPGSVVFEAMNICSIREPIDSMEQFDRRWEAVQRLVTRMCREAETGRQKL